jgi:hypothetical protein
MNVCACMYACIYLCIQYMRMCMGARELGRVGGKDVCKCVRVRMYMYLYVYAHMYMVDECIYVRTYACMCLC